MWKNLKFLSRYDVELQKGIKNEKKKNPSKQSIFIFFISFYNSTSYPDKDFNKINSLVQDIGVLFLTVSYLHDTS